MAWQSLTSSASEQGDVGKEQINASKLTVLIDVSADEHLSAFIIEALESNPSLQQTLVTLRQAQLAINTVEAQDNLNVDASISGSKTKQTGNTFSNSLSVSWELDLWQRIADGVTAANLDAARYLHTGEYFGFVGQTIAGLSRLQAKLPSHALKVYILIHPPT